MTFGFVLVQESYVREVVYEVGETQVKMDRVPTIMHPRFAKKKTPSSKMKGSSYFDSK